MASSTKSYNLGRFNEGVNFLRPERTVSDSGARSTEYVLHAQALAEISDDLSEAKELQQALAEEESYCVKTWTIGGVTTEFRVEYDGRMFDIVKIQRQMRGISFYYIKRNDL